MKIGFKSGNEGNFKQFFSYLELKNSSVNSAVLGEHMPLVMGHGSTMHLHWLSLLLLSITVCFPSAVTFKSSVLAA